jgi:AraC family transcriptional regulator, transcriptional activator of pobA
LPSPRTNRRFSSSQSIGWPGTSGDSLASHPPSSAAYAAVPSAITPARSFRASTSVRDYARDLGVTTSHLNESLRLETGLTAGELIRARLLLEAKRLLLHSELTMAGIGYELGFEDPSYFSRFIRRELKTSPAEFRSLIRQKYQKFMR